MSWLGGYKPKVSEEDLREARRQKLEADRLQRAQQRTQYKSQLEATLKAQREADQAVQDLLEIDPHIFDKEDEVSIAESEVSELLSDTKPSDKMVDFDAEDGVDGASALSDLKSLGCPFNKEDIEFWFMTLEGQLEFIEVKSQWLKRMALQKFLPMEIQSEVKALMILSKTAAGNNIYLRIKKELLDLYGSKPEEGYNRAKNRVLTGKPSQLGKALINDLCKKEKKLEGCCCDSIVSAMFKDALPIAVRNHIAEKKFTAENYKEVFKSADQVFDSNSASEPVRQVAAVTKDPEVAAVQSQFKKQKKDKNKGQGNQNGQKGQNGQNSSKPNSTNQGQGTSDQNKPKKPVISDEGLCKIHQKWRNDATFCAAPWGCKMKNIYRAPQ